jgi:hypothetical protein
VVLRRFEPQTSENYFPVTKGSSVMPDTAHDIRVTPSERWQKPHASAFIYSVAQNLVDIRCLTKEMPFIP